MNDLDGLKNAWGIKFYMGGQLYHHDLPSGLVELVFTNPHGGTQRVLLTSRPGDAGTMLRVAKDVGFEWKGEKLSYFKWEYLPEVLK